jgi:hypothetical protein
LTGFSAFAKLPPLLEPLSTGIAMFRSFFTLGISWRLTRWGAAAAVVACLGLAGCCEKCNLRGDKFQDNSFGDQCRSYRTVDKNNELFGLSNKAQQIEKDVGVR